MPTSTIISYAEGSSQYIWDSVTGFLYTAGGLNFYIVLTIILGVAYLGISALKGTFNIFR